MPAPSGSAFLTLGRQYLGWPYIWGKSSPEQGGFDCSGYVRYIVNTVFGYERIKSSGARYQLAAFGNEGKVYNIPSSQWQAGDIIYIRDPSVNPEYLATHVGFALGNGNGLLHAANSKEGVIESRSYSYAEKYFAGAVRLSGEIPAGYQSIKPALTAPPGVSSVTPDTTSTLPNVDDYWQSLISGGLNLTNRDTYRSIMDSSLTAIQSKGSNRGHIVDLKNGGSFEFILPEFNESNIANYDMTSIPGRSAEVLSYVSTSGRKVSVSLELFAGEGLYTGSDPIGSLQRDIAFLKSLTYPKYGGAIVTPPPVVLCYLGPELSIKGIVSSVNTEYKRPYTIEGIPMRATVSFEVTQVTDNPADYLDMRNRTSRSY